MYLNLPSTNNYLSLLLYFRGLQRQSTIGIDDTIQGRLVDFTRDVLKRDLSDPTATLSSLVSSRTDVGVHALNNTITVDFPDRVLGAVIQQHKQTKIEYQGSNSTTQTNQNRILGAVFNQISIQLETWKNSEKNRKLLKFIRKEKTIIDIYISSNFSSDDQNILKLVISNGMIQFHIIQIPPKDSADACTTMTTEDDECTTKTTEDDVCTTMTTEDDECTTMTTEDDEYTTMLTDGQDKSELKQNGQQHDLMMLQKILNMRLGKKGEEISEDPIVLSSSSDCYSDTSTSLAPTIDPVVINKLKKLKDEVDRLKAEESDTDSDVTLYFGDEDNFKGPPSRKRKSSDYTCTHVQQGT
ncbi:unnamed protein product [Mytilus coruscus]|uniref:Uncharacterized protein n=1 Tax=Mytilus coruscus TaxID=42192 RepID=A0A6J8D5M4_MYTCO|nr:unnamed protein product [Mytilus coruscus]